MNQIPLPTTIEGESHSPKLVRFNKNQIYTNGALVNRPALVEVAKYKADIGGVESYQANTDSSFKAQSLFEYDGELYSIAGGDLYRFNTSTNEMDFVLNIPALSVLSTIRVAMGYNGLAVIPYYEIDLENETATNFNIPNNLAELQQQVLRISNRYVYRTVDLMYSSEVNDHDNVDELNFFDAETYVDQTIMMARYRDDLIAFGTESIERFRATESTTIPFRRIQAAVSNIGYVSGLIELEDALYFIGRDSSGGYKIYSYTGRGIVEISSGEVNDLISQSSADLSPNVRGEVFLCRGERVLVFKFQEFSVACTLSGGQPRWSFIEADYEPILTSNINNPPDGRFPYKDFITMTNGKTYCHDKYGVYEVLSEVVADNVSGVRGLGAIGTTTDSKFIDAYFQTYVRDPSESVLFPSKIEISLADWSRDSYPFPVRDRQESASLNDFVDSLTPEENAVFDDPRTSDSENLDRSYENLLFATTAGQSVWLQVSKNGLIWSPESRFFYNLGSDVAADVVNGPVRCVFNPLGGFGRFEGYFGIRVGFTEFSRASIDNMTFT